MHDQLLLQLGLSPNEAKIYEALITYGGSGVSTISLRANVHRRNAYDTIHRLIEKGLVYEVFQQGETVYDAVEPNKLMELIREKELSLAAALPDMLKSFRSHHTPQRAYIYKGVEGMKNVMREAMRIGEDIFMLGAEGAWLDPALLPYTRRFLQEAARKKMKLSVIFDNEVMRQHMEYGKILTKHFKFLPPSYSTDSTMAVFGDHVVTYKDVELNTVDEDVAIFVMVGAEVAESYRAWWRYIWDTLPAPKIRKK